MSVCVEVFIWLVGSEIMPSFERSGIQDTFKIENFR